MKTIILSWLAGLFFRKKTAIYLSHRLRKEIASLKRKEERLFFKIEREEKIKKEIFDKACIRGTTDKRMKWAARDIYEIEKKIYKLQNQWTANYRRQKIAECMLKSKVWEHCRIIDEQPKILNEIEPYLDSIQMARESVGRSCDESVAAINENGSSNVTAEIFSDRPLALEQLCKEMELALQDKARYATQFATDSCQATEISSRTTT